MKFSTANALPAREGDVIEYRASRQDGNYPRPLLVRDNWTDLNGRWEFSVDDADEGLGAGWHEGRAPFAAAIQVPFTIEAPLSGIGDPTPHAIVWYRRTFDATPREGERLILHFGAIDYGAQVWVDGSLVGEHRGGQTAFHIDVTHALADQRDHILVIRAHDALDDPDRPRGKQDWHPEPHGIWYRRATGIWGSVWCEIVPALHVVDVAWRYLAESRQLAATLWLSEARADSSVRVKLAHDERLLADTTVAALGQRIELTIDIPLLRNAHEAKSLLWSDLSPTLIDAEIVVTQNDSQVDIGWSYVGLRSTAIGNGSFLINGQPVYLRSVLEQGYWPGSLWTAPSPQHLRTEVESIAALGFNAVRVHQKVEDPRFLYWCDRLGILVWAEIGAAYGFSVDAIELFTQEWTESVRQRWSYPSVVAWVPFNESWGIHDVALSESQQNFVRGITALTRALDATRPVISNDGWEHVDSDILTIHDYASDPATLRNRYDDQHALARVIDGAGPYGRRVVLPGQRLEKHGAPLPSMLTEFGGVAFSEGGTWGYALVADTDEFHRSIDGLFRAVNDSTVLAGFCYTQLTDTAQEANGLLREDRTPKLPTELIRSIVTGSPGVARTTNAGAPISMPGLEEAVAGADQ